MIGCSAYKDFDIPFVRSNWKLTLIYTVINLYIHNNYPALSNRHLTILVINGSRCLLVATAFMFHKQLMKCGVDTVIIGDFINADPACKSRTSNYSF